MPANHCKPHTEEAKAKMRAARVGKPALWKQRAINVVDGVELYRCGNCELFKPREEFYKSTRTSLGIKSECKPCHSQTSIRSRDQVNTRALKQASEANRRAKHRGQNARVSRREWEALLDILGRNCLCCGRDEVTQDHVVPLSRGGCHALENLQPLCRLCNEKKQARSFDYRTPEQRQAVEVWVVGFKVVSQ